MGGLQSIEELNWHGGLRGRVLSHKQTHAGKLAAEVVIDKAMGVEPKPDKKIQDRCFSSRDLWTGCPARQDSACLAQAIGRSPASLPAHVLLCPSSPWPRGPHTISRLTSINASGAAACHCFLRSYRVPPGIACPCCTRFRVSLTSNDTSTRAHKHPTYAHSCLGLRPGVRLVCVPG